MIVRCHRCAGEAIVTAPFSQEPQILYPDDLKASCEELKDRRATGGSEIEQDACAALRRAITNAVGGRDD